MVYPNSQKILINSSKSVLLFQDKRSKYQFSLLYPFFAEISKFKTFIKHIENRYVKFHNQKYAYIINKSVTFTYNANLYLYMKLSLLDKVSKFS